MTKQSTEGTSSLKKLNLLTIRIDGGTQPRQQINYTVVKDYEDDIIKEANKILNGKKPVIKNVESYITETYQNIDEGTKKLTGVSDVEPKSAEEIIKILKILLKNVYQWKQLKKFLMIFQMINLILNFKYVN